MKTVIVMSLVAAMVGAKVYVDQVQNFVILVEVSPLQNQGSLQTLARLNPGKYLMGFNNARDQNVALAREMGLIIPNARAPHGYDYEMILPTDKFCVCGDDTGYFIAVVRRGKIFRRTGYLTEPRPDYIAEWRQKTDGSLQVIQDTVVVVDPTHSPSGMSIAQYAIFEAAYPSNQFPELMKVGAGDRGSQAALSYYVYSLQEALVVNGCLNGTVDAKSRTCFKVGVYDNKTREAVIAFQRKYSLSADGIVGPQTRRMLRLGPWRPASWYAHPEFAYLKQRPQDIAELSQ